MNSSTELNSYLKVLEHINAQLYLIKENHNQEYYQLVVEGFWDMVKKGASALGSMAGTAVKTAKDAYTSLTDMSKAAYQQAGDLATSFVNATSSLIKSVGDGLSKIGNSIVSAPGKLWSGITSMANTVSSNVKAIYDKAVKMGGEALAMAVSSITNIFNTACQKVADTIKGLITKARSAGGAVVAAITGTYKKAKSKVGAGLDVVQDTTTTTFGALKQEVVNLGNNTLSILRGVVKGVLNVAEYSILIIAGILILSVSSIWDGIRSIFNKALQAGKTAVDVTKEKAVQGGEMFFQGIEIAKSGIGDSWSAMSQAYNEKVAPEKLINHVIDAQATAVEKIPSVGRQGTLPFEGLNILENLDPDNMFLNFGGYIKNYRHSS